MRLDIPLLLVDVEVSAALRRGQREQIQAGRILTLKTVASPAMEGEVRKRY